MTHADLKKHLADYLEGDLPLEHRAQVDAHLDDCSECAQDVAEMQETIQLLRMLPDPEPPPMVSANVMRRIRSGETEPGLLGRLTRGFTSVLEPSFVLPASAVAVAALVVAVVQQPEALQRFTNFGAPNTMQADAGLAVGWAGTPTDTAGLGTALVGGADRTGPTRNPAPRIQISIRSQSNSPQRQAQGSLYAQSSSLVPSYAPSNSPSSSLEAQGRLVSGGQNGGLDRRTQAVAQSWGVGPGQNANLYSVAQSHRGGALASTSRSFQASAGPGMSAAFQGPGSFESSGGEEVRDARDAWLVRGLADPVGFSHFLASKNLAEQELWVSRLAERALARGLLDDLVMAMRASGDVPAAILSDDFAAQAAPSGDVEPVWNAPYER